MSIKNADAPLAVYNSATLKHRRRLVKGSNAEVQSPRGSFA